MPEWLMGADCKSADERLRWFKSSSAQFLYVVLLSIIQSFLEKKSEIVCKKTCYLIA